MGRTWATSTSSRSSRCACDAPSRTRPGTIRFPIQGTGLETRAFVYIDDFMEGMLRVIERGAHLGVYHVGDRRGDDREGRRPGRRLLRADIEIEAGKLLPGSNARRCPDITKVQALGLHP